MASGTGADRGGGGARRAAAAALGALLVFGLGCVRRDLYKPESCVRPDLGNCLVEKVEIVGSHAVDAGDIKSKIATTETSRPLRGVLEHVPLLSLVDRATVEYERLDPFVLERDLARVERYYRARGYYEAHVRAGRTLERPGHKVRVEIVVDEGEPVHIAGVLLQWKDWSLPLASKVTRHVENAKATLKPGAVFEEEPYEATKKKILRALTDHGFAYGTVEGKANVDLVKHEATVVYTVELGPHCTFGPVTIEGNGSLPAAPLLSTVKIQEGQEFSTATLDSAENALGEYGVLGAIDVVPQLSRPPEKNPVVPVVFRVTPTPLRTLRIGGGAEAGSRVGVHGIIGWEHRNFLGGLRRFSVEARPGLVFYPMTLQDLLTPPTLILPEALVRSEFRQPGFLESRTRGVLSGAASIFRLQTVDNTAIDEYVVGYIEFAGRAGVERSFWDSQVSVGLYGIIQNDWPFSYKALLGKSDKKISDRPPGFSPITIPYVQATAALDLRKGEGGRRDPLNPHSGLYFQNDLQIMTLGRQSLEAGDPRGEYRILRDIRIRPELRFYVPIARKWTLALRGTAGLLFPLGSYGDQLLATGACSSAACRGDLQVLQFRAFFSGGANSNRGYPYNGVGPHELVPFSSISSALDTPVATGGLTLWEGSLELRAPLVGALGTVLFVDASNISRKVGLFDFSAPHLSTGLGLRYDTPVGPVRADIGVRIPCAQILGQCSDVYNPDNKLAKALDPSVGEAGTLFGLPIALSIAIGEAF